MWPPGFFYVREYAATNPDNIANNKKKHPNGRSNALIILYVEYTYIL